MQTTISVSTAEAELTSVSYAAKGLAGLNNLLESVGILTGRMRLFGDNVAALLVGSCESSIRNLRHLKLPELWVRELTRRGELALDYIRSNENTSDLLTKVLNQATLSRHLSKLSYIRVSSFR